MRWWGDKSSPDEIIEWVLVTDARQPRDRLTATRHHDLSALLHTLEMLAQPIMKLTYAYLVSLNM
jgi:hypothetical protein